MRKWMDVYVSAYGECEVMADENAPRRKNGSLDMRFAVNKQAAEKAEDRVLLRLANLRANEPRISVSLKDL